MREFSDGTVPGHKDDRYCRSLHLFEVDGRPATTLHMISA